MIKFICMGMPAMAAVISLQYTTIDTTNLVNVLLIGLVYATVMTCYDYGKGL